MNDSLVWISDSEIVGQIVWKLPVWLGSASLERMAPKPAKSPKKPTSAKTPKKSEASKKETGFENAAGESDIVVSPPTNKEEALAQMSFDGLPSCNAAEVRTMVGKKYGELVKIFAHYCKFSECTTVEMATRLSLNGFKRLVKDSGLEVKVYNLQQMSRLFNLRGGAKVGAQHAHELTPTPPPARASALTTRLRAPPR